MARTRYGRTFRTRRGRYGRYKYVNGRRVSFVGARQKYGPNSKYVRSANKRYRNRRRY